MTHADLENLMTGPKPSDANYVTSYKNSFKLSLVPDIYHMLLLLFYKLTLSLSLALARAGNMIPQ